MKRVAIPISENKLSEYFGGCNYYEVFQIDGKKIKKQVFEVPPVKDILELPEWLYKQGITDVIAFKVNRDIISLFASKKVNLFIGIQVESSEKLINDYLNGRLESDKSIIKELTN